MPRIERDGARLTLVAGTAYGETSPVATLSPTLYLAGEMAAGSALDLPSDVPERAVYLVDGAAGIDGRPLAVGSMAVLRAGSDARLTASAASRVAIIGGDPLAGERHLWWNFVSSSRERIAQAKRDWKEGRFASVAGDPEFIPLPEG
jgi:redox-sensitive bicupin YhaK (pirin superfamily)